MVSVVMATQCRRTPECATQQVRAPAADAGPSGTMAAKPTAMSRAATRQAGTRYNKECRITRPAGCDRMGRDAAPGWVTPAEMGVDSPRRTTSSSSPLRQPLRQPGRPRLNATERSNRAGRGFKAPRERTRTPVNPASRICESLSGGTRSHQIDSQGDERARMGANIGGQPRRLNPTLADDHGRLRTSVDTPPADSSSAGIRVSPSMTYGMTYGVCGSDRDGRAVGAGRSQSQTSPVMRLDQSNDVAYNR